MRWFTSDKFHEGYQSAGTVHVGWVQGPIPAVVAYLRGLGYTVTPPTEPEHLDNRPVEILGENGEVLGTFDPTEKF